MHTRVAHTVGQLTSVSAHRLIPLVRHGGSNLSHVRNLQLFSRYRYICSVHQTLKIVTQLPLRGLWTDTGSIRASRIRPLSSSDVRDLLRQDPVNFVVVDVGVKPRWIPRDDCYRFWMDEVQHRLLDPDPKAGTGDMPYLYCYRASEWQSEEIDAPIVVLELSA